MLDVRWMKLLRDARHMRTRLSLMVVAVAASIFGIGAILGAYGILTREIGRNYTGTNPAAATLEMERIDGDLLAAVRARPGIAAAEARSTLLARVQVRPGIWQPLLLFVVSDFEKMRIATFRPEKGAWPPPAGTILLERAALPLLGVGIDDLVQVKTPHGDKRPVTISGTVHDPALAPAWQEKTGYAYATPETLALLGEDPTPRELLVVFSGSDLDVKTIEDKTRALSAWLAARGTAVHEIRIPPPGRHPHQSQMEAILLLLLVFSLLALLLSAILLATTISGLMAREIRQIGIMKTIGASTRQIAGQYLSFVLLIGMAALLCAIPSGVLAGQALAGNISSMLNFTLYSETIPAWAFLIQIAAGLLVPLLVALPPIKKGARLTIREALADCGARPPSGTGGALRRILSRIVSRPFLVALTNAFRKRSRLVMTIGLLAAGGGMFLTALNVRSAWEASLVAAHDTKKFDFEIRLARPQAVAGLENLVRSIPGVRTVEAWGHAGATPATDGGVELTRAWPDRGHGSLTLRGAPDKTGLVRFPLRSGRWLRTNDDNAVVLNQLAQAQLGGVKPGENISLVVEGRKTEWQVVGIVEEIGLASAYATAAGFQSATALPEQAASLRVVVGDKGLAARDTVIRRIETALAAAGIGVTAVIADAEFRNAVADHISILIFLLVAVAVLMAIVGLIGLASAVGANVTERTREFGVMRACGGTPGTILRGVIGEAVFTATLSCIVAGIVAWPLSHAVGGMLGTMAFRIPLPVVFSPDGLAVWPAIVLAGSILASALPARRAARMSIRETLACE